MELVFLAILLLLMIVALTSGYPVAFALPGAAIISIGLAALCGLIFAGNPDAYFAQGSAYQWLSSGVTNFRSLYWDVERDTLIAIPLFIFMGIMLQRSKIAEDLLVAMAQLFGPVPGGLGISVVLVGALLAATTGIVGATVIAMGLISLPAMMRNKYSLSLASGTICASGTLGQIIPPSIVLIILADQLANAADQANIARKAEYKDATGEFAMPSAFDVSSASAGDMFMGAFIPGLLLVGIYALYIFIRALIRPQDAPPVPYQGDYDRKFFSSLLIVLVPPLALIFIVLGSILLGVATVNQAGSIGAIGAMIMGGYRLGASKRHCYTPAIMAVGSIVSILILLNIFTINIKNIQSIHDVLGIVLALIAVVVLCISIVWSIIRAYQIDNTLVEVMIDTAKTTSMVFIILIGAAMLTSAFRGFGGEELVKHYLTSLPGGFWTQFIVVMLVIFLLGFFLDFIEIAVVVVPIVAPILLADPSANITAVWLGVMVGLNIQTSFLTPPFGFALFYLRGVAPPSVKTTQIYKGAVAFIGLQLLGLSITGYWPTLVNYLPYRVSLTSETAPPPINPRLQLCIEEYLFDYYRDNEQNLLTQIGRMQQVDRSALPAALQQSLDDSLQKARGTFAMVEKVRRATVELEDYSQQYRPISEERRRLRRMESSYNKELQQLREKRRTIDSSHVLARASIERKMNVIKDKIAALQDHMPSHADVNEKRYRELYNAEKAARENYRRHVDESYQTIQQLRDKIAIGDQLRTFAPQFAVIEGLIQQTDHPAAVKGIKSIEGLLVGSSAIRSLISQVGRALKGSTPNRDEAMTLLAEAESLFKQEVAWREKASSTLAFGLEEYNEAIKASIGLRLQERLTVEQAHQIAACQSIHRDISLNF